jgi:hypothetical protein
MESIINIIETVKQKFTQESDMVWTGRDSAEETSKELDLYIRQLRDGNMKCLANLADYFAPTGFFQEHSLSNGWGYEYLELAKKFDAYMDLNRK